MRPHSNEAGFSLIEMLVAITLFSVLSVGFYQVMIAQARTAETTRSVSRIADEARLGFNRMIREVREADNITYVSADRNQFTIQVNYNGDSFYTTANDEILTFTYDPAAKTISMCAALTQAACNASNTEILMAGVVPIDDMTPAPPVLDYFGNDLEYDWGSPPTYTSPADPPDGIVEWIEVDAASGAAHNVVGVGDNDGTLDAPEFPYITSIRFALEVEDGTRETTFHANVQMRNKTT